MDAIVRIAVPTGMLSCGIHKGMAPLPVEMSLKACDCPGQPAAAEGAQQQPADDGQQHHHQQTDHGKGRQRGGLAIQRVKESAHSGSADFMNACRTRT